jgi:hypothetical protein
VQLRRDLSLPQRRRSSGGPSTYGECFGALSWHVAEGHFGGVDLEDLRVVMTIRYLDDVITSTKWDVFLYVSASASDPQFQALGDIFLGRAGGAVADLYGPAIGTVHGARRAAIRLEHVAARRRIDVVGHLHVEAEDLASTEGDVRCGIPGFDHPGTELHGEGLTWHEGPFGWDVIGRRHAAFTTDFDYRSSD